MMTVAGFDKMAQEALKKKAAPIPPSGGRSAQRSPLEVTVHLDVSEMKVLFDREIEKLFPIPMILHCPICSFRHIDRPNKYAHKQPDGTWAHWANPPHRSHLCAKCGAVWRPADVPTTGVAAIKTHGQRDTVIYDI